MEFKMAADRLCPRRNLLRNSLSELAHVVKETKDCFNQASECLDFFSSTDSCFTLTRHYPRELYEEEAEKLGIDIDEVGIDEAVRLIFKHHGYSEGA